AKARATPESSEQHSLAPQLAKGDRKHGARRVIPWALLGIAAALGVSATVTGLVAKDRFHDLERACPNKSCPPDKHSDSDSGTRLTHTTDVLASLALGTAAAAATLFILGKKSERRQSRLSASLLPTRAMLEADLVF